MHGPRSWTAVDCREWVDPYVVWGTNYYKDRVRRSEGTSSRSPTVVKCLLLPPIQQNPPRVSSSDRPLERLASRFVQIANYGTRDGSPDLLPRLFGCASFVEHGLCL